MIHRENLAGRLPSFERQPLGPNALEPVTPGKEIDYVAVRRPPNLRSFSHANPLRAPSGGSLFQGCNEHSAIGWNIKREPAPIGRVLKIMDRVLGPWYDFRSLTRLHV